MIRISIALNGVDFGPVGWIPFMFYREPVVSILSPAGGLVCLFVYTQTLSNQDLAAFAFTRQPEAHSSQGGHLEQQGTLG